MKYTLEDRTDSLIRSLRREVWVMRALLIAMAGVAVWAAWQAQTACIYWSTYYAPLMRGHP